MMNAVIPVDRPEDGDDIGALGNDREFPFAACRNTRFDRSAQAFRPFDTGETTVCVRQAFRVLAASGFAIHRCQQSVFL